MKNVKSEMLAISRAGHDKDSLYVVLKVEGSYCWLTDGKRRLLENPKKKKLKHVQMIIHLPEGLQEKMQEITLDADIRKIIKEYRLLQEQ